MYENMMIFMYFQGKSPANGVGHYGESSTAFVRTMSDMNTHANEHIYPVRSLAGIFM